MHILLEIHCDVTNSIGELLIGVRLLKQFYSLWLERT